MDAGAPAAEGGNPPPLVPLAPLAPLAPFAAAAPYPNTPGFNPRNRNPSNTSTIPKMIPYVPST